MEFDGDQDNSRSRSVSSFFGAIFMCSNSTKKECFERCLFGLPSSQADFVKQIKKGMVLFLFEYEERKLYGVFRATSCGAMNIKPKAFRSSGKQFPAQICFEHQWKCHPLSEHEFRDVFKDNYYTTNKFSFGLSEDQVHKLLLLFSSRRKDNPQQSEGLTTSNKVKKKPGKFALGTVRLTDNGSRYVTTDRTETEHAMDNDTVPVNLTRYPTSPRPNQTDRRLGSSEKLFAERDDPSLEGSHLLSLPFPHSVEPQLSDVLCTTSHVDLGNQHRCITPYNDAFLYRDSSFPYRHLSTLGIDHGIAPAREQSSYSKTSTEGFFPQFRNQLISTTHLEPRSLITSSTRLHSPNAVDNLRDYIPLNTDVLTPEYGYLGSKNLDSSDFEGQDNRLAYREHSVPTMCSSRNDIFERENTCSSSLGFASGNVASPVLDHEYTGRGMRYWKYDPSTSPIFLSSDGKSHLQLSNYPEESGKVLLHERLGYDYSTDGSGDGRSQISLHSDTQKMRRSVFSRLTKVKNMVQDQNDNRGMNLSVEQLMAELHHQNRSRKEMKNTRRTVAQKDDHDLVIILEKQMSEDDDSMVKEEEKLNKADGGQAPLVNFKRRRETRKGQCETGTEGCVKGVDSVTLSVTPGKRRKLVRPSFVFNELNSDMDFVGDGKGDEGSQNESNQNVDEQDKGNSYKAVKASTHEDPKIAGVSQEVGATDCLFNEKGLAQDVEAKSGDHREIAEKGSSTAEKVIGDGSLKTAGKGNTAGRPIESNFVEDYKERLSQKLGGPSNCSLDMQGLTQEAVVSTVGLKGIVEKSSSTALQYGSSKIEGKRNTELSLNLHTGQDNEDYMLNVQGLSKDVAVGMGDIKQIAKELSSKAPQELSDGSFKNEGKGKELYLSIELNTKGCKEKEQSQGLIARDFSLNVQGLSQDAAGSNQGLPETAKRDSIIPLQEFTDGSFESESKGKEKSQELYARGSLQGLAENASFHTEADKEKCNGKTEDALTCNHKQIKEESYIDLNTSLPDISIKRIDNQINQKSMSPSIVKVETTATLVDGDGDCEYESKTTEMGVPSQSESEQRTGRRVKKILKRVKKGSSNPSA